jgi:hypothetical protein
VERALLAPLALPQSVLSLPGMSSALIRQFLNSLASSFPPSSISYLEIGVYLGSTLVSSATSNENRYTSLVAIDNFAEFDEDGRNHEKLFANLNSLLHPDVVSRLTFMNQDCWAAAKELANNKEPVNVYLYDGPHDEHDHYRALADFYQLMANDFVFIVDDYNQERVQAGTKRALNSLSGELEVLAEYENLSRWNGDLEGWWDGIGVFVLRRRNANEAGGEL